MGFEEISGYVSEISSDSALVSAYHKAVRESGRRRLADSHVEFGRRLAWYAFVRALKPEVIVETGTDKGLGSIALASALLKNGTGRLITIDINPAAGYLITGKYKEVTTLQYGDSVSVIGNLKEKVGFFLHDSNHSASHERAELEAIAPLLTSKATVLSDNAHVTDVLACWARENGRQFLFFAEQPKEHWYRGSGIGVAW